MGWNGKSGLDLYKNIVKGSFSFDIEWKEEMWMGMFLYPISTSDIFQPCLWF